MNHVLSLFRALQVHATDVELWIGAASWEFSHNNNMTAARALLQRGIRFNKTSTELYFQYLRLELLYMLKLRERRALLADTVTDKPVVFMDGDEKEAKSGSESESESESESDSDVGKKGKKGKKTRGENYTAAAAAVNDDFFLCAVPITVFSEAIKGTHSTL